MIQLRGQARTPRCGVVVVLVAVCLVVLTGMMAIALDGGRLLSERRRAQANADAAALAAASDLYYRYWTGNGVDVGGTAKASALSTAAANGYRNDGAESKVTVHIPPTTGDYVGKAGYAEVLVEFNVERSFSNIFARGPIAVRARAVAVGSPVAANVGIMVLDPARKAALNVQGGGTTIVEGTPVIVNSNHFEAAVAGGGSKMAAPEFDITGNYSTSGGGLFEGDIKIGQRPMPDPLADLPVPDPTQMVLRSHKKTQYTHGTKTLSPGVYKGGISASGDASLVMEPGIYYMDGGGFSFTGRGSLMARGVMIYNAPGNGQSDGITISGQGSVTLTPPTSGLYQGMSLFQDRTKDVTATIQGNTGTTHITGTFYFAGALLDITGNGGMVNLGSQYISRMLNLGGNGQMYINWSPHGVARVRDISLVE